MFITLRGGAYSLLAVIISLAATPVSADEKSSEALIKEGVELRRIGNDAAALKKFLAAFDDVPSPRTAAQLGLCEQAVGRWADAEVHLTSALENRAHPWVAKNLSILRDAIETGKSHIGTLEFSGGAQGALLTVNGKAIGKLPINGPVRTNAGSVHVQVDAQGFERWTQRMTLEGGQYQTIVIDLTSAERPIADLSPAPMPPPGPIDLRANEAVPDAPAPKTWLWVGAGALLVGVALTVAVLTLGGGGNNPSCPTGLDACSARSQ